MCVRQGGPSPNGTDRSSDGIGPLSPFTAGAASSACPFPSEQSGGAAGCASGEPRSAPETGASSPRCARTRRGRSRRRLSHPDLHLRLAAEGVAVVRHDHPRALIVAVHDAACSASGISRCRLCPAPPPDLAAPRCMTAWRVPARVVKKNRCRPPDLERHGTSGNLAVSTFLIRSVRSSSVHVVVDGPPRRVCCPANGNHPERLLAIHVVLPHVLGHLALQGLRGWLV
jgi:hypothetical protein